MTDLVRELQTALQAARLLISLNRLQGSPEWAAVDRELQDFVVLRTQFAMDPSTPLDAVARARHEVWMASWFKHRVEISPAAVTEIVDRIASLRKRLSVRQNTDPMAPVPSDLLDDAEQVLKQFPQARQQWTRSKNFES